VAARRSWTGRPERPRRYKLGDRWKDFRAGRTDGKKRIPEVISGQLAVAPDAGNEEPQGPDPDQATPDAVSTLPVTPHLHALKHHRNQELARLREVWYRQTRGLLLEKIGAAETAYVSAALKKGVAKSNLEKVSDEPTDEELRHRRVAEQDEEKWPEARVRDRRRNERDQARQDAEDDLLKASAELNAADVSHKHAQLALDDQLRAVRAEGWQVVHHYGKREASYLRALARKHEQGPELVKLLKLAGPGMPDWLLQTTRDAKEG
jgi:hypothetical protein